VIDRTYHHRINIATSTKGVRTSNITVSVDTQVHDLDPTDDGDMQLMRSYVVEDRELTVAMTQALQAAADAAFPPPAIE
jgi:hypothetical protein